MPQKAHAVRILELIHIGGIAPELPHVELYRVRVFVAAVYEQLFLLPLGLEYSNRHFGIEHDRNDRREDEYDQQSRSTLALAALAPWARARRMM